MSMIEEWKALEGIPDLKRWVKKFLTTEQEAKFDTHIERLQEYWNKNEPADNPGMSVHTHMGKGSFSPVDDDPDSVHYEDVEYFAVSFIMDTSQHEYAIYVIYEGDKIIGSIACLPNAVEEIKLH